MKNEILNRFLQYVAIDTQSDDSSTTFPSTAKQFNMLNLLHEQLKTFGLSDVSIDENGYVMGTLPSNTTKNVAVIGFVSHVDTSPDMSGANIKPRLVENYDGKDILLNAEKNILLSPVDFPEMKD